MQNQEILEIIENLKGRRSYEEKKASKLGFSSLYAYFEDKIYKEKKALEEEQKRAEEIKTEENLDNKSKSKSCSCC
jgi:hypothetical protein|tara:strand:- start:281 stop:508 length:228 start_codon:yes stop_codon:yes gene_type:complete